MSKQKADDSEEEEVSEEEDAPKTETKTATKKSKSKDKDTKDTKEDPAMIEIGEMRFAYVSTYRGQQYVHIREFYENQDGERKHSKRGIALTVPQWHALKGKTEEIDQALQYRK